ncbi:conserved hypothetical protein [Ricinus communis]|uniref:Uncharacterized protein n=1 Tax=Ricinus communis TaxID=3988 RepID=B9TC20_RICCO|nr:conserved hypothetical protein [Ricinus communis]
MEELVESDRWEEDDSYPPVFLRGEERGPSSNPLIAINPTPLERLSEGTTL